VGGIVVHDQMQLLLGVAAGEVAEKDQELLDADVLSVTRGPSRLSGRRSCPCCRRSNPNAPTAPATGGR